MIAGYRVLLRRIPQIAPQSGGNQSHVCQLLSFSKTNSPPSGDGCTKSRTLDSLHRQLKLLRALAEKINIWSYCSQLQLSFCGHHGHRNSSSYPCHGHQQLYVGWCSASLSNKSVQMLQCRHQVYLAGPLTINWKSSITWSPPRSAAQSVHSRYRCNE